MTKQLATTYKNAHAAAIIADMRAKRGALIDSMLPPMPKPSNRRAYKRWQEARRKLAAKVPYPKHEDRVVMRRAVADGVDRDGQPKTRLEDVTLAKAALPVQAGVTVEIIETDFTGGRDENGQKVEDGRGAVINITTAEGTLKVHEGYHREGDADRWKA